MGKPMPSLAACRAALDQQWTEAEELVAAFKPEDLIKFRAKLEKNPGHFFVWFRDRAKVDERDLVQTFALHMLAELIQRRLEHAEQDEAEEEP